MKDYTTRRSLRSAIYTRVSTNQGLEQDFNSLDAQREASEAYIKSQAHEGWKLIRDRYDDGGYSGGSMDQPDHDLDPTDRRHRCRKPGSDFDSSLDATLADPAAGDHPGRRRSELFDSSDAGEGSRRTPRSSPQRPSLARRAV